MKHRPSSLPILAQCPCFQSGTAQDFTDLGSDRHAALKAHLDGDDGLLNLLDDEDQAAVRWAADYIKLKAPMADHPLVLETRRYWDGPNFEERSGTPDVICGPHIFDFKWRPRNYAAQMADYALSLLPQHNLVWCHLLFGATKKAEVMVWNPDSAEKLVFDILAKAEAEDRKPTACDYCGWCALKVSCPALTGPAKQAALGYTDQDSGALGIANWHPSQMTDPAQIALGLTIWRTILKKWGESMEFHANEAATKLGLSLPGYELKERQGKKFVTDVKQAFELVGLPAEKFLAACSVRLNTSKTYPDQVGLDKLVAEQKGLKVTAAKRDIEATLAPVLMRGKPTISLVSVKDTEDAMDS